MVQKINVDSDHLSKESDTEEKTFKRPTLPKVTLFGYNLLLDNKSVVGTHTVGVYYALFYVERLFQRKFQQFF